jgi:hypothetical protein
MNDTTATAVKINCWVPKYSYTASTPSAVGPAEGDHNTRVEGRSRCDVLQASAEGMLGPPAAET